MEELMICTRCGEALPRSKLELMKTGTIFHHVKDYLSSSKRLSFALQKTIFRKLHFG